MNLCKTVTLWSWDDIHAELSRPQAFYSLAQFFFLLKKKKKKLN